MKFSNSNLFPFSFPFTSERFYYDWQEEKNTEKKNCISVSLLARITVEKKDLKQASFA